LLHAWTESLALGISFAKFNVKKKQAYPLMIIFCSAGPIGVGAGWIMSSISPMVAAIFSAIAAGTFIFIASCEIIVEEFSVSKHKWLKLLFYLIGIGVMVLITGTVE
jgi:zinc transporter 1/2/3